MKTKTILIFITIAMAAGMFANVRAPYHREGYLSGHISAVQKSQAIILEAENLSVIFPKIIMDKFAPYGNDALTEVQAAYFVNNKSEKNITLPVAFLGLQVENFTVKLNGAVLETKTKKSKELNAEFFKKLIIQRFSWNNAAHKNFIRYIQYVVKKNTGIPEDRQTIQDALKILNDEQAVKSFFHHYIYNLTATIFNLDLKPGKNNISIIYKQRMSYREGGTRYGSFIVEGAVFSFDYLIYPALSWKAAPDFKLKIAVSLPDVKEERFFKDRYYALQWESNVNFSSSYNSQLRMVSLSGEFDAFPCEILTFVLKKGTRR